ncbi:15928_t:CDS:2, partial [Gigaspora rosea]
MTYADYTRVTNITNGRAGVANDPTRRALAEIPGFQWCRNGCGSGQMHVDNDNNIIDINLYPQMECVNCEKMTCCKHKVPWHYGQTCEEYEKNVQCPKCKIAYTPVLAYK